MNRTILSLIGAVFVTAQTASAQQVNDISTELELGGIITTGNTEDENIKYRVTVDWDRTDWEYRITSEGFRSSKSDELAAQRLYHVASANYNFSDDSFVLARLAYEDDRFSGYDSQSDFSLSYGRNFLNNIPNMELSSEIGLGIRRSVTETDEFDEGIVRVAGNYEWGLSESATFIQRLTAEAGDETTIYRSETAIETQIVENWLLKLSYNVKHQTDVPPTREKTDTVTAVTLVLSF
ncbi:MAG: DUF481 domain-containing protein [Pseudohongiellaceae bacterium]